MPSARKRRKAKNALASQRLSLRHALNLDMGKWFKPTAENYFGKVSKAQILEALREANGSIAPAWARYEERSRSLPRLRSVRLQEQAGFRSRFVPRLPKTGD